MLYKGDVAFMSILNPFASTIESGKLVDKTQQLCMYIIDNVILSAVWKHYLFNYYMYI